MKINEPDDDGDEELPAESAPAEAVAIETAEVPDRLAGQRLDAVAARLFPDWSRARIQSWMAENRLKVNGQVVSRVRTQAASGDRLELAPVREPIHQVEPQDIDFDVVYQDSQIAVVFKPAGLTTHPGAGQPDGTLQNGLLHRFPQTITVPRSGIVHRLDKNTSGILVVALDLVAHSRLVSMLARREIRREYDAVANGTPVSGATIDAPIGRSGRDRLKMAVTQGGRSAVTHFRIQERFSQHTHLRVRLETGRTHQIRVHLAFQRMPLVGDSVYGGGGARGTGLSPHTRTVLRSFSRQALHARSLKFDHPVTGEPLSFEREMPEDMLRLLEALKSDQEI